MSQGCVCAGSAKSTGRPDCVTLRGITKYLAIGPWKNSAGTVNAIAQGTVIDEDFVTALLNESDKTARLYVLPEVKRVLHDRADDPTEDVGGGLTLVTGEKGIRKHTYELIGKNATEEMLAALRSHFCGTVGFHEFTNFGNITGTNTGDGNLRRTKIQDDSFMAKIVYAQEGVIQKIVFSFIVDETEDDAEQDYITNESIEYKTHFWYSSQPKQVLITEVLSSGLTSCVVKLSWLRLRWENDGLTGFVSADFNGGDGPGTIHNKTDNASVTVVATESTVDGEEGQYTLTFAAQDDQDELVIDIVKDGYDAEPLTIFIGPTS